MPLAWQKMICFVKVAHNIILGMIICTVLQMMTKKRIVVPEKYLKNLQVGLVLVKV